jgi:hypothetical protein
VQTTFYSSVLLPHRKIEDRVIALLHHIVNTQSQPKIDKLLPFFKHINKNRARLKTFDGFLEVLGKEKGMPKNYVTAIKLLEQYPGWGEKTAALFIKSVYHLHNGKYPHDLKLWKDAPTSIDIDDQLFLPVDAVIKFIFKKAKINTTQSFVSINKLLAINYKGDKMEVWDDLWFWGFITQKGDRKNRIQQWNEAKYWALIHTNKKEKTIAEVKIKAREFIKLIK